MFLCLGRLKISEVQSMAYAALIYHDCHYCSDMASKHAFSTRRGRFGMQSRLTRRLAPARGKSYTDVAKVRLPWLRWHLSFDPCKATGIIKLRLLEASLPTGWEEEADVCKLSSDESQLNCSDVGDFSNSFITETVEFMFWEGGFYNKVNWICGVVPKAQIRLYSSTWKCHGPSQKLESIQSEEERDSAAQGLIHKLQTFCASRKIGHSASGCTI